jgi:hypothetical protein
LHIASVSSWEDVILPFGTAHFYMDRRINKMDRYRI